MEDVHTGLSLVAGPCERESVCERERERERERARERAKERERKRERELVKEISDQVHVTSSAAALRLSRESVCMKDRERDSDRWGTSTRGSRLSQVCVVEKGRVSVRKERRAIEAEI